VGLHISSVSTGFIGSLGMGFVTVEDDEVLGFVAFTTALSELLSKSVVCLIDMK